MFAGILNDYRQRPTNQQRKRMQYRKYRARRRQREKDGCLINGEDEGQDEEQVEEEMEEPGPAEFLG